MVIYWRTKEIWCPYPANDCIEKRIIEYSKSKKKFLAFMITNNSLTMYERKKEVEKVIQNKLSKLIRINTV